jgi:hypothetical protein
MAQIN